MSFVSIRDPECVYFVGGVEFWEWEPGDMTRYKFLVAYRGDAPPVFSHYDSVNNCAMPLPEDWNQARLHEGYVREKTGCGVYEASVYVEFLAMLALPRFT